MLKKITSVALVLMLTLVAVAPVVGLKPVAQDYDDYNWDYDYDTDYTTSSDAGGLLGGTIGLVIACCASLFGLAFFVIWVISFIHCIQHAPADKKTMWILLMLFLSPSALVYFFTKRKEWGPKKVA